MVWYACFIAALSITMLVVSRVQLLVKCFNSNFNNNSNNSCEITTESLRDFNAMIQFGETTLSVARAQGHEEITKILHEHGAAADVADEVWGTSSSKPHNKIVCIRLINNCKVIQGIYCSPICFMSAEFLLEFGQFCPLLES